MNIDSAFYEQYRLLVHHIGKRYRGVVERRMEYEDATQEVWLKLAYQMKTYDPTKIPVTAYVAMSIRWAWQTLATETGKKLSRQRQVEYPLHLVESNETISTHEAQMDFQALMRAARPSQRADIMAWLMKEPAGKTGRKVGNISYEGARQKYFKAVEHLKKKVEVEQC